MKVKSFIIILLTFFWGLNWVYGAYTKKDIAATQQTEKAITESMPQMNAKEYGEFRGKKLNFFERLSFHAVQHQAEKEVKQKKGFNFLGFLLGFLGFIPMAFISPLFLFPFGVLGTYVFSKNRNLRKWAWIGFGAAVFLSFVALVIIFSNFKVL